MQAAAILLITLLITTCDAAKTHSFRETSVRLPVSHDIVRGSRASPETSHDVIFVIQQNNVGQLIQILDDVSDPSSSKFGKHMSRQEVADLTANPNSHEQVMMHLRKVGAEIISESLHQEYITVRAPVRIWEEMFDTEFHTYSRMSGELEDRKVNFLRCEKYSVPAKLDMHIASVFNTVQIPKMYMRKPVIIPVGMPESSTFSESSYAGRIYPAVLNSAYNISSNIGHPRATQAVFEAKQQFFSPVDLATFESTFNIPSLAVNRSIGQHSVKKCNVTACGEGSLDVQYLIAISQSPTTYYYTDLDFSVWLLEVSDMKNPPLVLSISYGAPEHYMTRSEMNAFNFQAIKLNLMGITILVASGDDGVMERGQLCGYYPSFPATSPYILAVGATMGIETGTSETVCQSDLGGIITSGGGFSAYYPMPSWQKAAGKLYTSTASDTNKVPYKGYSTGRGYPDITAAGAEYLVIYGGALQRIFGTSASTPVVAGMISLVNAARLKAGRSSLGWINPTLYSNYASFTNDVTSGSNHCAAQTSANIDCCIQGFSATPGWDPVSGLGSLNFGLFLDFMMTNITGSSGSSTAKPSAAPSIAPSASLSVKPTSTPTAVSTALPSAMPLPSATPSAIPKAMPSAVPTVKPSIRPSTNPTANPTVKPSSLPSVKPTRAPAQAPSGNPSTAPRSAPTTKPSVRPSSLTPSVAPSVKIAPASSSPSATFLSPLTAAPTTSIATAASK